MARKPKVIDVTDSWTNLRDKHVLSDISERNRSKIKPKTAGQERLWRHIMEDILTVSNGPAGTGKTLIPCAIAAEMLSKGLISKIIISRPLVTCGNEEVGHLPGGLDDKTSPYIRHIKEMFADLLPGDTITDMVSDGRIEFFPLAYMRGYSLRNCFVLLDEAENATRTQLKMVTTRIGENCKLVITGDLGQSDIPHSEGFSELLDLIDSEPYVTGARVVTLSDDDIVRSGIVKELEKKWRKPVPKSRKK